MIDGVDVYRMTELADAPAWVRLVLWCCRVRSVDIGGWGYTTRVRYKDLFGRQYFVCAYVVTVPPQHPRRRCSIVEPDVQAGFTGE